MSRQVLYTALLMLLPLLKLAAQDDEFKKYMEKEQQKYEQYVSEEDKKFTDFLKKEWVKQGLKEPEKLLDKPKPKLPPAAKPEALKQAAPVELKPVVPEPVKPAQKPAGESSAEKKARPSAPEAVPAKDVPTPPEPPAERSAEPPANAPSSPPGKKMSFDYCGEKAGYSGTDFPAISLKSPVDNKAIAAYWEEMSKAPFTPLLNEMLRLRKQYNLNDWGYVELIYDMSSAYCAGRNERRLFTWYFLVKSGYRCRAAYTHKSVLILLLTDEVVYNTMFFSDSRSGGRFYVAPVEAGSEPEGSQIFIYTEDFPGSDKTFSFSIRTLPKLTDKQGTRTVKFSYRGKEYSFPVVYNEGLIKYYEYYPQIGFGDYFTTEMSAPASGSVLEPLRGMIKGMDEKEAANFLLHFVQQATEYKTDGEQFRREKPFFAEESLYYKYSDCEDRAVLYAYLVRNLLGLKVVGLNFPEHIATAVRFRQDVKGDFITQGNDKYVICDPTFIGADIGMCMPQYKTVSMEVIDF